MRAGPGLRQGLWQILDNLDGLAHSEVNTIAEDNSGQLWFGTSSGVSRYDGESFTTFTTQDGLADNRVSSVTEQSSGHLWFGTWGGGVSRYDRESFTTFTTQDGLADNIVHAAAADSSGNLWFGTDKGISRYDGESFTTFTSNIQNDPEVPDEENWVRSILIDRLGRVWFGTWGKGVSRIEGDSFGFFFTTRNGLAENWVSSIFEDTSGQLWFGTWGGGVSRYDGKSFTTFTTQDSLGSDWVPSIFEDASGQLWFLSDGLKRYKDGVFIPFTIPDRLSDLPDQIFEDGASKIWWFVTDEEVSRFDGESSITRFPIQDGLVGQNINSILEDSSGHVWFCTDSTGVSCFDGENWTTYTTVDGLVSNKVGEILQDRSGQLWFATNNGVSRYDGESFTTLTTRDGLAHNRVETIYEDRSGNMWFGTWGGGVSRYDGESFTTFTTRDGLTDNEVSSIKEDDSGNMWFGTWGGGVSHYDGFIFQNLRLSDGLSSNRVFDISQNRKGNIWVATADGITRYHPRRTCPPIHLKNVIADRSYGSVGKIRLSTTQEFVTFEFLGISYRTRPNQVAYVYRLDGLDTDWQQTRERRITYTDLPVGEYTFEVKAVDRDLNYSEEPATVEVTIHPPYDQIALWSGFGISLIGLLIASGYGIKRSRERNRAQQERFELQEQLNQELEEELQTAHDMQMGLMPKESPKITGFDIAGRCLPANHVGGDFFQYFHISPERILLTLADVTGHAMEAAIPVVMFSGILETQMESGDSLEELFGKLNRSLSRILDRRTFVCFSMGDLNPETRKIRLSNGGCPYPYHFQGSTGEVTELQVDAYPLGVRAGSSYPVIEEQLAPGDCIVFCSDGIIEAENSEGEIFGFERTARTIRNGCQDDLSAPQLLDHLIGEVKSFTGETPQGDDQTIVVLRVET